MLSVWSALNVLRRWVNVHEHNWPPKFILKIQALQKKKKKYYSVWRHDVESFAYLYTYVFIYLYKLSATYTYSFFPVSSNKTCVKL